MLFDKIKAVIAENGALLGVHVARCGNRDGAETDQDQNENEKRLVNTAADAVNSRLIGGNKQAEKFFDGIFDGFLFGTHSCLCGIRHFCTSGLHEKICEDGKCGGEKNGDGDDLNFAPSAFFKVMMDRRHLKDAFFCELIPQNLHDDGNGFDHKPKADHDDDEWIVDQKRES